jgi:hypothetical protein
LVGGGPGLTGTPKKRKPKPRCVCDSLGLEGCPSCQAIIARRIAAELERRSQ